MVLQIMNMEPVEACSVTPQTASIVRLLSIGFLNMSRRLT